MTYALNPELEEGSSGRGTTQTDGSTEDPEPDEQGRHPQCGGIARTPEEFRTIVRRGLDALGVVDVSFAGRAVAWMAMCFDDAPALVIAAAAERVDGLGRCRALARRHPRPHAGGRRGRRATAAEARPRCVGKAPVKFVVANPEDAVQWVLYFPVTVASSDLPSAAIVGGAFLQADFLPSNDFGRVELSFEAAPGTPAYPYFRICRRALRCHAWLVSSASS